MLNSFQSLHASLLVVVVEVHKHQFVAGLLRLLLRLDQLDCRLAIIGEITFDKVLTEQSIQGQSIELILRYDKHRLIAHLCRDRSFLTQAQIIKPEIWSV